MRTSNTKVLLVMVATLIVAFAFGQAGEDSWFDAENCDFCVTLSADPTLLENTTWEHHDIDGGIISVSTVAESHLASFNEAMDAMKIVGEKMEKGETVKMCNMCTSMGGLMMKGAKYESVQTKHGSVGLMTSADPEITKMIQEWGAKTMKELAMAEEAEAKTGHEGHDH